MSETSIIKRGGGFYKSISSPICVGMSGIIGVPIIKPVSVRGSLSHAVE